MSVKKYLDEDGAILLNQLLATKFASKADVTAIPTNTSDLYNDSGFITKDVNNLTYYTTTTDMNTALAGKLDTTLKGANNGLAELDANGKVPSSQLPAYVDDIVEGYYYNGKFYEDSSHTIEITGETGKIYVDLATELTYRWGGSSYVEISPSLALGETSTTAYRGDRGKTAYDHATDASRLTTAQTSGFYKFAVTAEGHIASVTAVAKSDLTGLGVEDASNKVTSISSSSTDTEYPSAKAVYTYAPPKSHASTATTYGAGTTTKYGHCMTIDDLNLATHANGKALSAHQGYVLDQGKQNKLTAGTNIDITSDVISTKGDTIHALTEDSNIWELQDGIYDLKSYKAYYNGSTDYVEKGFLIVRSYIGQVYFTHLADTMRIYSGSTTPASPYSGELHRLEDETRNKVTSISASSTDAQYPSAKLLYDQLLLKHNVADGDLIKPLSTTSNIWQLEDGVYRVGSSSAINLNYKTGGSIEISANTYGTLFVRSSTSSSLRNYHLLYDSSIYFGEAASSAGDVHEFSDLDFGGTTGTSDGRHGLVPAPVTTDAGKFLKADGTWANVPNEIQTLTSNIAIWNTSPGIYKIPANSKIYYMGATDQHNFTVSSTGYLFITDNALTKQFFILAGSSTNRYLYNGYTTETTGQYKEFNIGSSYLTSISSYVKDNLTYSTSGTTYALSAYQGYVLDQGKENVSNKVTSLSSQSTDTQYPSAKLVYDQLALKMNSADMVALTNTEINNIFDFTVANS